MKIVGTHHVALVTPNFDRQREFYVERLGLPVVGAFHGRRIVFIDTGSTTIELIEQDKAHAGAAGGWAHFAFEVADVDATYDELRNQGIAFHVVPKDFPPEAPDVRIAFFKDPDGNEIELVQPLGQRYPAAEQH
ncbi:MAG: VOC family protein [Herpetosiphonaceae bacterium]|nr:VOC family protein [Herpetosiphonaceae bacterium]